MSVSRLTAIGAQVLDAGGQPAARLTGIGAQVLDAGGTPTARLTGIGAQVLTLDPDYVPLPGKISLLWDGDEGDTHTIYYARAPMDVGALPTPVASVPAAQGGYDHVGTFEQVGGHYYRVGAVNAAGEALSDEFQATLQSPLPLVTDSSANWDINKRLSQANLDTTTTTWHHLGVAHGIAGSGTAKAYFEVEVLTTWLAVGVRYLLGTHGEYGRPGASGSGGGNNAGDGDRAQWVGDAGNKRKDGVYESYSTVMSTGEIIGVLYDQATGELTCYRDGVSLGVMYTLDTARDMFPQISRWGNGSFPAVRMLAGLQYLPAGATPWYEVPAV